MAKQESGANGSRTRGFMLAPPYAGGGEMQGGGGGWLARALAWVGDGAMIFSHKDTKAQKGVRRFVAPDHRPRGGILQFFLVIPAKAGIRFIFLCAFA